MKTQRNFKCKECGIFSVAYDTRDRRLFKIFPCKCGKVEVSARGVDSFAIFKGDNFVEDLLQEEINPTVEYYPEDYLTLPGEIWGMMEKAEELGNKINDTNKPGEYYSDISEGMVTLELSGLSDNGEKLTITASGRFFDEYSWHSKNPEEVINRFKESLERFINIEEKVLTDEINLNNARSIWDNEEFECAQRKQNAARSVRLRINLLIFKSPSILAEIFICFILFYFVLFCFILKNNQNNQK